jgi:hypothetical protein
MPVLTQYWKIYRDNIAGHPPSCDEPHGEATASSRVTEFEHRGSLTNLDMERTEVKKVV